MRLKTNNLVRSEVTSETSCLHFMLHLTTTPMPVIVQLWAELERLWTKLLLPKWQYNPGFWLVRLRKTTKTSASSEIQTANIPNTSQKQCATASVWNIRYLSYNSQCPKNNAISMERVTNTHWKQLWNYTVVDADWNLIMPYRVSKLIRGEFKNIY